MISEKTSKKNEILIIDDEADICFLLKNMLSQKNFVVSSANSLSEGFSRLEEKEPSVLFLDLNLPDGSGLDAISKIKKIRPSIKIVVISAYDSAKERNTAKGEGADFFVSKPFNKQKIYESLEQFFNGLSPTSWSPIYYFPKSFLICKFGFSLNFEFTI